MWEIDIENQLFGIGAALGLGAVLCMFYDILRSYRRVFKTGIIGVSAGDIFFWLVSAILTFTYFLIFTNGEIRGYLLLAELSGFILCRTTLSKLFYRVLGFVFKILKAVFSKIEGILSALADKILIFFEKILKILKKALNYLKKLLKSGRIMLYTKKDNSTENSES